MGTRVGAVEQQTAGAVVWTACAPNPEHRGQAGVDVPLVVDCLPLPERNRGNMTGSGEEDSRSSVIWKSFSMSSI